MRKIYLVIFFICLGPYFFYLENKRQKEIDKTCLDNLNLQLVGVVDTVDRGENFHGYGIIYLRIISSNILYYDPRAKQEFYFCIIKNGFAEMYDHASLVSKGDTLIYNTKDELGGYLRKGIKEEYGSIEVNADEGYNEYIRKHSKF